MRPPPPKIRRHSNSPPPAKKIYSDTSPQKSSDAVENFVNPIQVLEEDAEKGGAFRTGYPFAQLPRFVSTPIVVEDEGNCSPRFMRSTLYHVPRTSEVHKWTRLPFAVAITPLAALNEHETEPLLTDFGPNGPVRCKRCDAYSCPFMEFEDEGWSLLCPFCHNYTEIRDDYHGHLDSNKKRIDRNKRPELFLGAYEMFALGEKGRGAAFIFLIDASPNAVKNGMLKMVCSNLEQLLENFLPKEAWDDESNVQIGLGAFDKDLHLFDLSKDYPKTRVVSANRETPSFYNLVFPLKRVLTGLRAALVEIQRFFEKRNNPKIILQQVVEAGLTTLQCANRAGKLIIFSTALPTHNVAGKLKTRQDDRFNLGTDEEKIAMSPQITNYTTVAERCANSGVTVDLFLFPSASIDVPTIGELSSITGGSIFMYQNFTPYRDGPRFMGDLEKHLSKNIVFDCVVKVQPSAELQIKTIAGFYHIEPQSDLIIATIDEGKSLMVEFEYQDDLILPACFIQTTILYTALSGERRIRILNMCLPASDNYDNIYADCDPEVMATFFLKRAIRINLDQGAYRMSEELNARCVQMFSAYRTMVHDDDPSPSAFFLPHSLKLLPVYVNSIQKLEAVSGGSEMTVDDKAYLIELIRGMRVEDAMPFIYPRVMQISQLQLKREEQLTELPSRVRANYKFMNNREAYFIDNGVFLFIWIGGDCFQSWVQDVFGVDVYAYDIKSGRLPLNNNDHSHAVRRAIELLPRGIRERKIIVVCQKSTLEPWMNSYMAEENSGDDNMSYAEYLHTLHRNIVDKIKEKNVFVSEK